MGLKTEKTACNINSAFDPGTANECTVQWWFKNQRLENEEHSGWTLEIYNDQLRDFIEVDTVITTWKGAREVNINHSMAIWNLKQTGKLKKLEKWVPHELTANKKKKKTIVLKCHFLLFFPTTANHFLIGLWCAMKSGFYMITSDGQLSVWTMRKLQSTFKCQTCTKKSPGHCLVVWCPSDTLQISESQWNHYI